MTAEKNWNQIAQQEVSNGKAAQDTHTWSAQDREKYDAARLQAEQQARQ